MTLASVRILYPDDQMVDVAILLTDFRIAATSVVIGDQAAQAADHIQLGAHLNDWIDDGLVLMPVTVFGFPTVSTSINQTLVAARGEINAVVDTYVGDTRNPKFIISPLARGGYSGGPVLVDDSWLLGVVTDALVRQDTPTELGHHSVTTVEPIFDLLFYNGIFPGSNAETMYMLRGAWDVDGDLIPLAPAQKARIDRGEFT